jgi:hypothetical protein
LHDYFTELDVEKHAIRRFSTGTLHNGGTALPERASIHSRLRPKSTDSLKALTDMRHKHSTKLWGTGGLEVMSDGAHAILPTNITNAPEFLVTAPKRTLIWIVTKAAHSILYSHFQMGTW